MKTCMILLVIALSFFAVTIHLHAQGTAFTYQGRLNDGDSAANGIYDLRFAMYDAASAGVQQGNSVTNPATTVSNGLFTVALDFGDGFPGARRWLEIGVRTNGGGDFSTLSPRQSINPAPYAIMATGASNLLGALPASQLSAGTAGISITGSAASVTGGFAGDVTGTQNATVTSMVGGIPAANVAAGAIAANGATSTNLPGTLVKRDGTGSIAAGSLTLSNTLTLPDTTLTVYSGSNTLLHTDNENNTAYGLGSLYNSFACNDNTAVGFGALFSTGSSFGNTAVGSLALYFNTTGAVNTAVGSVALYHNTTGSANTAVGDGALGDNTTGYNNTAVGSAALTGNTDGAENSATGEAALYSNTHGSDNTADGAFALYRNVSGNANTAIGFQALTSNTNGADNTAVGNDALYQNIFGHDNTAVGSEALAANQTGYYNTAVGYYSLSHNTNASGNTAVGDYALFQATNSYNTANGYLSLYSQQFGTNNVALGYKAGYNLLGGNNNIFVGSPGLQNQTYIAGIYGVIDNAGLAVYVEADGRLATAPSSTRFKEDIHGMDDASDVLLSLHPVTFRYRSDLVPNGVRQFGLVAEEVNRVAPDLVVRDNKNEITGVRYEAVNAMLLNEFLKEHHKAEEQDAELRDLKQRLAALEEIVRDQSPK